MTSEPATKLLIHPLPKQASSSADKSKLVKWTAEIRNPWLPSVASPIPQNPHPCSLAPSPTRHAAQVTLPPAHHIWLSRPRPVSHVTPPVPCHSLPAHSRSCPLQAPTPGILLAPRSRGLARYHPCPAWSLHSSERCPPPLCSCLTKASVPVLPVHAVT